jgi:hypothetical protein
MQANYLLGHNHNNHFLEALLSTDKTLTKDKVQRLNFCIIEYRQHLN